MDMLYNPDQAEEIECKEEWIAKFEVAVTMMQKKLSEANYRFKVASANSYLNRDCRSILIVVYWKKGMEEALLEDEQDRKETEREQITCQKACCSTE